jgi:hypothetical protein
VATFFLIRYQTVVAIRTDITFARQFSRVSLARRTESNFARQLFEVSLFIIGVQQNFRDALTKPLRSEIALDSPPMANGNAARAFGDQLAPQRPIPAGSGEGGTFSPSMPLRGAAVAILYDIYCLMLLVYWICPSATEYAVVGGSCGLGRLRLPAKQTSSSRRRPVSGGFRRARSLSHQKTCSALNRNRLIRSNKHDFVPS